MQKNGILIQQSLFFITQFKQYEGKQNANGYRMTQKLATTPKVTFSSKITVLLPYLWY